MNLFFTADEHYGHSNRNGGISFMCNRPYANLEEMKEAFIANHNAKVPDKNDSLTVHLGDMFWRFLTTEECCEIMDRLNGKHAYIRGNHEEVFHVPDNMLLQAKFVDIADVKLMKVGKKRVWLSHYAHRAWPKSHQGAYHLFGHTHGVMPPYRRSRDAGVDANNYSPLSFDELDQWASKLVLEPDEIEKDMLAHPWPQLDHLPEGSH